MSNSNELNLPKPGVSNALSFGWATMKINFLAFFLVVFLLSLLDIPMEILGRNFSSRGDFDWDNISSSVVLIELFAGAYFLLFMPIFDYGADMIFVQGVRKQKIDFRTLVIGVNNYLNIVLNHLLIVGLVGMAMVALIIPGIIVGCRLAFSSYLIMDKGMDPISAVETSWKLTRGHGWKIFGLGVTSIFICILGFVMFFVGIFPAVMWVKASFATLYQSVLDEKGGDFFLENGDTAS